MTRKLLFYNCSQPSTFHTQSTKVLQKSLAKKDSFSEILPKNKSPFWHKIFQNKLTFQTFSKVKNSFENHWYRTKTYYHTYANLGVKLDKDEIKWRLMFPDKRNQDDKYVSKTTKISISKRICWPRNSVFLPKTRNGFWFSSLEIFPRECNSNVFWACFQHEELHFDRKIWSWRKLNFLKLFAEKLHKKLPSSQLKLSMYLF